MKWWTNPKMSPMNSKALLKITWAHSKNRRGSLCFKPLLNKVYKFKKGAKGLKGAKRKTHTVGKYSSWASLL